MKNEIARTNDVATPTPGRARAHPSASSLEGMWVEVMKAGDYGDRGRWTPEQLDQLVAAYNPRLHPAPVVLGHPAHDAPAYGWVRGLRRAGHSLWAQLEKVEPALEELLRAGRFRQRSVSLYQRFPLTGGPYLRHLGFLGAAAPAVKGLAPVRLSEAPSVSFAFDNDPTPEVQMPEPKSKIDNFLDHLRSFFTPSPSHELTAEPTAGAPKEAAFVDRLAELEQRLDALTTQKQQEQTNLEEGLPTREQEKIREQIANFVESLRARGRFPPAFERLGVADFMHRLAAVENKIGGADIPVCQPPQAASRPEGSDNSTAPSLLAWFQHFLTRLPTVIEFCELSAGAAHGPAHGRPGESGSRLVRFTEPHRGMTVDPASVELAERAEALAAELNISYAEALARLREENRTHTTTA